MRKEIGIWLNTSKAVLVNLHNGKDENVHMLESEVESRTRFPGERKPFSRLGSLLTNTSSRITNRKKQQMHQYFSKILSSIDSDVNELYLFGPSIAKIEFEKELRKHQNFTGKPIHVESADKMTEKQMIAHVKHFFENNSIKHAKATH
jgi:hypothetical protein